MKAYAVLHHFMYEALKVLCRYKETALQISEKSLIAGTSRLRNEQYAGDKVGK